MEPIKNGYIPVNEHGNIEIWNENTSFVPEGSKYINNNNALKAAKNLEIPYVPVIIGFESKGNYTIPKMKGIVVLNEYEQVILDAIYYLDAINEENYIIKKDLVICKRWEKLVNNLLSRQKLKQLYGH